MASQLVDSVSPGIIIDEKMINKAIESPYGGLFDTLERIVLTAESRSDLPLSAAMGASASRKTGDVSTYGGPLSTHELAHLSLICAAALSPLLTGKEVKNQGFGSIDGDLLMALIPLLDHHVEAAASVDLIREASKVASIYNSSKRRESGGGKAMITDTWLKGASNLNFHSDIGPGTVKLLIIKNGLEAASILLAIMTSPGVDRRVISEDSIESCLSLLRQHLSKNITPALTNTGHLYSNSACAGEKLTPTTKKRRRESGAAKEFDLQKELKRVYKHCIATIPQLLILLERCENLIHAVSLDDQPVLNLCSTALSVFTIEPSTSQNDEGSYCVLLQASGIGLVTTIFRTYPAHRYIVVEDLFPVMLNLPTTKKWIRSFPLPMLAGESTRSSQKSPSRRLSFLDDQNFVQSFSILIVTLVQTCVVMPRFESQKELQLPNDDSKTGDHQQRSHPELKSGLTNCTATSDMIVSQLLQRCGRKGEEGGASEFRPVLQNLIDDLLKLQLLPDYPASEMLLLSFSKIIGSQVQQATSTGLKGSSNILSMESTYLTTVVDVLGKICATIAAVRVRHRENPLSIKRQLEENREARNNGIEVNSCQCGRTHANNTFMVSCDICHGWSHGECVGVTKEVLGSNWVCDDCKLKRMAMHEIEKFTLRSSTLDDTKDSNGADIPEIMETHVFRQLLLTYLASKGQQNVNSTLNSAREFLLASWVKQLSSMASKSKLGMKPRSDPMLFCRHFLDLWSRDEAFNGDIVSIPSLNNEAYLRLITSLTATQSELVESFPRQMGMLVGLISDDSASHRKQAVKALSQVLEADTKLMLQPMIKKAVSDRFQDESKSVREAIVSLVGNFVVQNPEVANAFAPSLLPRLNDEGVSVRKKTIRIFHEILTLYPTFRSRTTACVVMLRRAADPREDDNVRDLIHALFSGLWLGGEISESALKMEPYESISEVVTGSSYPSVVVNNAEAGIVTPNSKGSGGEMESRNDTSTMVHPSMASNIQVRCRIASEQMVEVVSAAKSKDILSSLLHNLLFGLSDADKDRKASDREKRKKMATNHCSHLVDALFEYLLTLEECRSEDQGAFAQTLIALLRTIGVLAEVAPLDVLRHINTLLPYLKADNGVSDAVECDIVSEVCDTIFTCSSVLRAMEYREISMTSMANDFLSIIYRFGSTALNSSIKALSGLAHHAEATEDGVFVKQLLNVATTFYGYLVKTMDVTNNFAEVNVKVRSNVHRALAVMGALCRNDVVKAEQSDAWMADVEIEITIEHIPEEITLAELIQSCYRVFSIYLLKEDCDTKCSALRALGGIFVARPRVLLAMEQSGSISELMSDTSLPEIQLQALRSWQEILLAEENRVASGEAKAKMEANAMVTLSKKIQGDQDSDATLVGGILSQHAYRLFQLTACRNPLIRYASLDLLGHLLRQGLINPMQAVPFLFGLQGDIEVPSIRSFALELLTIESEKRPEMIRQRVCAGIKQAYRFQIHVYPNREVTAVIQTKQGDQNVINCIFSSVFKDCIRSSAKNKTGLFRNLFSLFYGDESTETMKKGTTAVERIPLLSFVSQVLAHLPYSTADDPLFLVYNVQSMVAVQGQQLVDKLSMFLQNQGIPSVTAHDELNTEQDTLEIAASCKYPSRCTEALAMKSVDFKLGHFVELCAQASAIVILLRLKTFLRTAYNISEARCLEYSPENKEQKRIKIVASPNFPSIFDSKTLAFVSSGPSSKKNANKDNLIRQYAEFRLLMRLEQAVDVKLGSEHKLELNKCKLDDAMENHARQIITE